MEAVLATAHWLTPIALLLAASAMAQPGEDTAGSGARTIRVVRLCFLIAVSAWLFAAIGDLLYWTIFDRAARLHNGTMLVLGLFGLIVLIRVAPRSGG